MKILGQLGRTLGAGFIGACAISAGGCSYFEQFFIANGSSAPLVVIASAGVYPNVNTGERICSWVWKGKPPTPLRAIAAEKVRRDFIPFENMAEVPISAFDEGACTVRVTIAPGSAALLWETSNGRRYPFLMKVELSEAGQTFEGAELLKRFHKRSRAVYVIEYK